MSEHIVRSFREAFCQSIIQALGTGTAVVLPSEIAAEFWRREVIRSEVTRAIREDRIISWDRFKERAFDLRTDRLPANRTVRALFVERLIAENAADPFLARVVPFASAANAEGFRAHLTRILPALPQARLLHERAARTDLPLGTLLSDLAEIERRYTAFLDEHHLFEPAWLERVPAYQGGDHLLVLPELAEDFPEFESALAGVPRASLPPEGAGRVPGISLYPDSRTELEATLGRIAALLDAGVAPESIVLTVADLDAVRTRVEQAAELAAIPISVRQGLSLAASAPGRFFASIADVVSSGFSLDAMKRFLLNRAVPWRDPSVNARLVLAGAERGCLGGRGRPDPGWKRIGPSPERDLVETLMRDLPAVTRARTAGDLRTAVAALIERLVDSDRWRAEDESLVQRCRVELRALSDFERNHSLSVDAPYRFWIDRLSEQLYVPRGGERGVAVLPYRVGAAVYPEHHFVVNASNGATRVTASRFPFLTDAEREKLGEEVADRDLSGDFVRGYAVSGEQVSVSCSRTTWDGPTLPPGEFVAVGRIRDAGVGAAPDGAPLSPFAAWRAEESFETTPRRVYRLQRDGAAAYAAGAPARRPAGGSEEPEKVDASPASPRVDLVRHPISDPELVRAALDRQRHERHPELISLSANDVERFRACPFSYLLFRVLGLRDLDYTVDPDNARDVGSLYHKVLEEFFRELHAAGRRFDPQALPEYRELVGRKLRDVQQKAKGMVPEFVSAANEPLAMRVFERLFEHDAGLIAGHSLDFVEQWEHRFEEETGAYLVGRVDRVTRAPDGSVTLVDYKKRRLPTLKAQNADSKVATGVADLSEAERTAERDRLGSVQIPFYVRLLESSGERVGTAAYYSLEEGSVQVVVSDDPEHERPVMSRERMDEVMVLVYDIVRETVRRVLAGDYSCGDSCGSCDFRGVCRTKFVVR